MEGEEEAHLAPGRASASSRLWSNYCSGGSGLFESVSAALWRKAWEWRPGKKTLAG